MKRRTVLQIIIIAAMTLASCQKETELDRYRDMETEQSLTLNSVVCPDSTIAVSATRPFFYNDEHTGREHVKGLSIYVWINGTEVDSMRFDESRTMYVCTTHPQTGDTVTLHTSFEGREVTATTYIPSTVEIDTVTVDFTGPMNYSYYGNVYRASYRITFHEPAETRNYYFLWIDNKHINYDGSYRWDMITDMEWKNEMVFQNLAKDVNNGVGSWEVVEYQGLPFSDRDIDGQTYTINVAEYVRDYYAYHPEWNLIRRIRLFSITEDYYRYLVSILAQNDEEEGVRGGLIQLGVIESRRLHSNIVGGLGFFGAYSASTKEVDIIPFLTED